MGSRAAKWALASAAVLAALAACLWLAFGHATPAPRPAPLPPMKPAATSTRAVVGRSAQGREIEAYTFGGGPTHLLFVGGIHGGYEWNSVVLAYQALDYLAANPAAVPASESVTVVPNVNPDGVFKVVGKEGRFAVADVPKSVDFASGRFNGHGVDLNRNFDCQWQPKSTWQSREVSGGTAAFSEPEAAAVRDLVASLRPAAVVFWHSKANGVYGSSCGGGVSTSTLALVDVYAKASGYPAVKTFDAYAVTGAAEDWLAKIGVPAVTVELSTHESVDLDRNLAGVRAVLAAYAAR